jgi:hypothetical protein
MKFHARYALFVGIPLVVVAACGDSADSPDVPATTGPGTGDSGSNPTSEGGSADDGGGTDAGNPGSDAKPATDAPSTGTKPTTVFTVMFENHDYNEIVGSANCPYFNSLIAKYGLATNYNDSGVHPSLPNYLTMISGDPQYPGIVDLNPKTFPFPVKKDNLGTQLQAASIPWRAYQESMGTACRLTSSGDYAPKHDPFLYFDDIQNGANDLCKNTSVDYSQLAADLTANTYRYLFITPNLINDGHDPTNDPVAAIKQADLWASTEIEKIIATPAYKNGGAIFITWDEAEGRNNDSKSLIPMIVVSESIKSPGFKTNTHYTHKSYLATIEDIFGLPRLATVKSEASMLEFFQ